MAKQKVAAYDGVMVKAGGQFRTLFKDGAVPEGADADHVKVLVDRGLLVDGPDDESAAKPTSSSGSASSSGKQGS